MRILLCLILSTTWAGYDPTNDLISAFCSNDIGPRVGQSLNHSRALTSILKSIRDDETCRQVHSSLSQFVGHLNSFQVRNDPMRDLHATQFKVNSITEQLQIERAQLLSNQRDILFQRGHTPEEAARILADFNPSSLLLSTLESELVNSRIDLIDQNVENEFYTSVNERERRLNKILMMNNQVETLFSVIKNSPKCLKNQGALLAQIGAQIIGSSASVQGGIVGASIMGGGLLVASLTEFIQNLKYGINLRSLKNSRLGVALSCSLEGLAKNWCESRDTQLLLDKSLQHHRNEETKETHLFQGINILSKDLPPFMTWLQRITAGSSPSTSSTAQERIHVLNLRFKMNSAFQKLDGILNEGRRKIENISGTDSRSNIERIKIRLNVMKKVSGVLAGETLFVPCSGCAPRLGPYGNSFVDEPACGATIYIFSKGLERKRDITINGQLDCSQYIKEKYPQNIGNPLTLSKLDELISLVNQESLSYVMREISQILEENADLVMARLESEDPRFMTSPKQLLSHTKKYLEDLLPEISGDNHYFLRRLVTKTLNQIKKAKLIVDEPCSKSAIEMSCPRHAAYQVTQLGLLLAPNQQTFSLGNSLQEIVKQHIDRKLKNGEIEDEDLRVLLRISPQDSVNLLLRNYLGIQRAKDDAAMAKNMTEENLKMFGNIFSRSIQKRIKKLSKAMGRNRYDRDKSRELSLLCLQTLLIPSDSFIHKGLRGRSMRKRCWNREYQSDYYDKLPHLSYNEYQKKNFGSRVCSLYDFRRKTYLFETYGSEAKKLPLNVSSASLKGQ